MTLNPLKLIEQLNEEHGSATIQSKNLTLLRDQITMLQEQSSILAQEKEDFKAKYENLKAKWDTQEQEQHGEKCPFCNKKTGQLKRIESHKSSLMNQMGNKTGKYQCADNECNQQFERTIQA